jgi:hypothetical protein
MIQFPRRFLALSLLPALLLPWATAPAGQPRPEPVAAAQTTEQQFASEFRKYREVGDLPSAAKLVRREEFQAQSFAITQLELLTTNGSEEINSNVKLLRAAWKDVYRSDAFLTNVERYLGSLTPGTRNQRSSQIQAFNNANNRLVAKLAEERSAERAKAALGLAAEIEPLAQTFVDLGDQWMAARVFHAVGYASDTLSLGDEYGKLADVFRCYTRFVELRTSLALEDRLFKDVQNRLAELAALGFEPGTAPEAAGEVVVGIKFGTPRKLQTTGQTLELPGEPARPGFSCDVAHPTWSSLYFTKVGTEDSFKSMERSPIVRRTGAAEIEVVGSDGTSQKVALTGKITRIDTTTGTSPRPWSFFIQVGGQNDVYHDIQANLSPSAENLNLYTLPASMVQVTLDEVPVQVFDDNLDGIYGSRPLTRGYSDITKGEFQVDIDSMRIGKQKSAVPFSEFLKIGEAWYRLVAQDSGASFEATPVEVVTGSVELEFKGPFKPSWIVIQGLDDNLKETFFELTAAKKIEVPIGRYAFLCGGYREGERPDGIKKCILTAGKNMPPLVVKPGEVAKLTLGAPFAFDFRATVSGNKVSVQGSSITVVGAGGERYHRLWNARVQPEVLVRKVGSKKGNKGGRMSLIGDAQTLSDQGFDKAWKPLDLDVENGFGDQVEVQLVQDKSKLFGKIESPWTKAQ